MKSVSKVKRGLLKCVGALAMALVVQTANSACIWLVHQPVFPEEARKFQKKV